MSRWRSATHVAGRPARRFVGALATAHALTAIVGVPAAQSRRDAWAVDEYKRVKASGSPRVLEAHPYIRTYAAVPVLSCLILSYHEYQVDGLCGVGSFELALWYGVGVTAVDVFPLWVW
jgi:hypothetical protein